jgi:hypothetical protein
VTPTTSKQETFMKTQITQQLAALGMALLMNGAIAGGIAYIFSAQVANAQSVAVQLAAV